jgi:hypothetical protein
MKLNKTDLVFEMILEVVLHEDMFSCYIMYTC